MIYDDNKISIEDDTNIAFTEDVAARYEAYGWHVQDVDWTNGGTGYDENVQALYDAIEAAKAVTDKPSFIRLHTIIGWPAPTKQNTGKVHGSALGADEVAATKKVLGFDPEQTFEVADDVIAHTRKALDRGKALQAEWDEQFDAWRTANPGARKALLDRLRTRELPAGWKDALPSFDADAKGVATRAASGDVLTALVAGAARAVGRFGRPGRLEQHHARRASRPSSRPSTPPRSSRATSTAGCCTSASASTPWARS